MNTINFQISDFPCAVLGWLPDGHIPTARDLSRCGQADCVYCNQWQDAHSCECYSSYKMPRLRTNSRGKRVCSKCGYRRTRAPRMDAEQYSERMAEIAASDAEG